MKQMYVVRDSLVVAVMDPICFHRACMEEISYQSPFAFPSVVQVQDLKIISEQYLQALGQTV